MKNMVLAMLFVLLPLGAVAEPTIIYDGSGSVQTVVRDGPSGPIIYDRDGRIVTATRNGNRQVDVVVFGDRRSVISLGTTLQGGVGRN